jgi:hypothetical protein
MWPLIVAVIIGIGVIKLLIALLEYLSAIEKDHQGSRRVSMAFGSVAVTNLFY